MEKEKKYNIGLDIGTTSVGWAVTELNNQQIMRKGNKALWGVRLFDEASTAEARRIARGIRRRYDRRRERIRLLQEEFKEEINKVDPSFYQKLQESKYVEKDRLNKTIILTKEEKQELKNYQNKYKTIYHLRNKLVNSLEKEDIRLVYLAIHHIIKYRGNFLYQNSNFNVADLKMKEKIIELFDLISNYNYELVPENYKEIINLELIEKALLNSSKNDTIIKIKEILQESMDKNFATEFGKLMVGNKTAISKLFMIETDKKISFSGTDYEDKYDEYLELLGDNIEILDVFKQLYDCVFLKKMFKEDNNSNISGLMIKKYDEHKEDLKLLKQIFNNNRKIYDELFRTKKDLCLYDKYVTNKIDYEDFKKELEKLFQKLFSDEKIIKSDLIPKYELEIKKKLNDGNFLPRITTTDNGKYPYQLNKYELIKIIENQGKYYPFLLNKISNKNNNEMYKIVKLLDFKIPYYIGPLVSSDKSKNAWLKRKIIGEKITPYNFDLIVDKEQTAEEFIRRMMSHCTYLLKEYALANNSILYSKFKVMNELKQIRINGIKIEKNIQNKIIKELFMKTSGSITEKKFIKYIILSGDYDAYNGNIKVTGYSAENKFANTMQSYIDFFGENGIFENTDYSIDDAEKIIEWVTIFEDKDILEKKIRNNYDKLTNSQIQKILRKKYSGWGSLSKKLLTEKYYKDRKTENYKSILDLMEETDENFMQILNNDEYKFQEMIRKYNNQKENKKLNYSLVEELATSPATKRGIYQSLKVVEEIIDYIGYEPQNIVIEMARSNDKKVRTNSRKKYLINLYEKCKNEIDNYKKLKYELDSHEITSQRLFLYFIQQGKCLYTGTPLNIEDIENQSVYEIDHIVPRTLIKDDSIDNKALVLRECNQIKKASYVLPKQYRSNNQIEWWKNLKKNNLISAKKYYNLTKSEYSDDDIKGFINRQLVETRQITKHVANILNNFYKTTKVIYLKAELSHNYRERYELFKFRDINDYHHAHDAYLAAVLGEYKEKLINNKLNVELIKEMNSKIVALNEGKKEQLKYGFVINSLDENLSDFMYENFDNFINKDTGEILFESEKFNKIVEDTLYRNDILISKKVEFKTGEFYNQTKSKKGNKGVSLKTNMPTELYGSYTSLNPAYAVIVEIKKKDKINKRLVGYPIYLIGKSYEQIEKYYKKIFDLSENDSIIIHSKKIPFYTKFNWNNQICYLVGASDKVEVCNALEFKFDKQFMKKNKYALNKLFNNKNLNIENYEGTLETIITYIVDKIKNEYALYSNLIEELKEIVNYDNYSKLSLEQKENIIKQLLLLLNCKSDTCNFKFLNSKYSSAFGKKNGRIIENAIIISNSVSGIREKKYEF